MFPLFLPQDHQTAGINLAAHYSCFILQANLSLADNGVLRDILAVELAPRVILSAGQARRLKKSGVLLL